jgi:DNA repair protein RecN (Recombination protein N)
MTESCRWFRINYVIIFLMLGHLRISNFALLEEIDIEFTNGLSLFTGETGAGKSILIDAICRLLGARATQDDVRSGATKAMLEAEFTTGKLPSAARSLLESWQIDLEEESLIVRREIQSSGKSRALLNNCAVTLQQLKSLSPFLIDVFGQNEHQTLLDPESQRWLYDGAIGIHPKVSELSAIASEIHGLQQEWNTLREQEQQRQRNIDILQFQIREIEEARISEEEEQELHSRKLRLQNSERINSICESLVQDLLESENNWIGRTDQVSRTLDELEKYDESFSVYSAKLIEFREVLNDMVHHLDSLKRSIDFEEGSLDELELRLDLFHRLKKKYGPTVTDVIQHLARSREELDLHLHAEERSEGILATAQKVAVRYRKLAEEISAARKSGRTEFEKKVESELKQVAMEKCRFRVMLEEDHAVKSMGVEESVLQQQYPATGLERVVFTIEPNPGEGFRELSRIASGGELSRLMLGLKVTGQTETRSQCLIFDEIDAGVGGRVAYQIGERLRRLARNAQVLCVTHLPQVAAFGDHHYCVNKKTKDHRTITIVEDLTEPARVRELARMMSGSEVTETTLRHARELRQQVEAKTG